MRIAVNYDAGPGDHRRFGSAPLSPAVKAGPFLFLSGQVAIDPGTGTIVGSDVAEQTRQVLTNVRSLVESAGMTMEDVVKVGIYLVRLDDFDAMNAVYATFFQAPYPARATVGIALNNSSLLVEMDAVAYAEPSR